MTMQKRKLLASQPTGFSLVEGLIHYKNRIWLGRNHLAQQHVLQALHSSGIGGHSGIQGTYQRVKSLFAWPKMKHSIMSYVKHVACVNKPNQGM
jgi:hypothetical protein